MAIANELVQLLSFKLSDQSKAAFETFKKGLEDLRSGMQAVAATATATGTAIAMTIKSVSDEAVQLTNLSKTTGIATKTLQEYKYAAESVGVSADSVTSDLQMLMETMSSPIPGEFNEALFMMGIGIRDASGKMKSADALLGDIADKLNSMNEQRALQWANRLGLSNDTLVLIKNGKLALEDLRKEANALGAVIPEEALQRGAEFKKSLNALEFAFKGVGRTVALSVAPGLTNVVSSIKDWIVANSYLLKQGLEKTVKGIGDGLTGTTDILGIFIKNIRGFLPDLGEFNDQFNLTSLISGTLRGALLGLLIIFTPMVAKLALVGTAFTVAALAIEDFVIWCMNGESALGKLLDKWDNWAERWKQESWWQAAIAGAATMPQEIGKSFAELKSWFEPETTSEFSENLQKSGNKKTVDNQKQSAVNLFDTLSEMSSMLQTPNNQQQIMAEKVQSAVPQQTTINNAPQITIMTGANAQEVMNVLTPYISTAQTNTPGQFTPFVR